MKIRQFIFASILLLTYSLEFAHNLLPHCHESSPFAGIVAVESDDHHEHAHSHVKEITSASQVEHLEHVDGNFLEYVICLLESSEHKSTNPEPQSVASFNCDFHQISQLAIIPTLIVPHFEIIGFTAENSQEFYGEIELKSNLAFYYNANIHRGPPSFSC